jgi:hypothetical protein
LTPSLRKITELMTPERWQQIEKIYHAVLEREPESRDAFLDEACTGDKGLRKALRTSPQHPAVHNELENIFFLKAMYEETLAETKALYAGDREMEEALTQGYRQSGFRGAMRRAADLLAVRARKTYVIHTEIAMRYAMAEEKAQALAWLEKGLEVRDPSMALIPLFTILDSLRSEPRFQALMRRMNLPP